MKLISFALFVSLMCGQVLADDKLDTTKMDGLLKASQDVVKVFKTCKGGCDDLKTKAEDATKAAYAEYYSRVESKTNPTPKKPPYDVAVGNTLVSLGEELGIKLTPPPCLGVADGAQNPTGTTGGRSIEERDEGASTVHQ